MCVLCAVIKAVYGSASRSIIHRCTSERATTQRSAPCEKALEAATSCDVEALPDVDARRERAAVLRRKRCDMMRVPDATSRWWLTSRQKCRSDSSLPDRRPSEQRGFRRPQITARGLQTDGIGKQCCLVMDKGGCVVHT